MAGEDPAASLTSGRAWVEFCDALAAAGRIIRERSPDTDVDRAEGYRYLTRLARMAFKFCIEFADPAAPVLVQYMDETQKFGVDNPDQLYQWARISGKYEYRLTGTRGNACYLGIGVYAGSAGRGGRRTVAHVNGDRLATGADGRLEVILSAREHPGNWIELAPDTTTMLVRQTMNDRATEVPGKLTLARLDPAGPPPPLDPARMAKGLQRAAMQILGSVQMFADLSDRWAAAPNVIHPRDDKMAEESFGDPDLYYAGGYWRIAPDEAMVVDLVPPRCRYWSFLLCNYWTESLDYRYRPIWTNGHRATHRPDGSVRIVVAAEDPRLPGITWLDTEGHREGTMTLRYLLAEATPIPAPRVVKLRDLRA
jgi:hypothetical protein